MAYVQLREDAGVEIKSARHSKKIGRDSLAHQSAVSAQTIARIEKGARRAQEKNVFQICDVLDLSPEKVIADSSLDEKWHPMRAAIAARGRDQNPVTIFVSAPMTAAGAGYGLMREQMHDLLRVVRAGAPDRRVFCALEEIDGPQRFEDEALALAGNLAQLRRASRMIAIYPEPMITSVLVEIGIALGLGIPTLVLVKQRDDLPWLLRGHSVGQPPFRVIRYRDFQDVVDLLQRERDWLDDQTDAKSPEERI